MLKASNIMLSVVAILVISGCGGGGGSSTGAVEPSSGGGVIDGYVSGATVFVDSTGEGEHNTSEITTTTDANGDFTLSGTIADGTSIYAYGGTDISTGFPFEGRLSTVYDATRLPVILSPLTTYVAAVMKADATATFDSAANTVALNLGLDASVINLDPMTNSDLFMAAQKVQKVVEVIASATKDEGETFNTAYEKVFTSLADPLTFTSDFNATELVAKVADDQAAAIDPTVYSFLEELSETIDELSANITSTSQLDGFGEMINTYAEVVEGALESNDTASIDELTATLNDMNTTEVAAEIEADTYVDPLIAALAEVESALDNNISYLGTNSSDANITADLVLSDPAAAPFDTADLNLTWSSNSVAVDVSTGAVTRSDTVDVAVQLKATVANSLVSNNRTFDLVVKRNEHAPVAGADALTLNEDDTNVSVDVLANDTDANADVLAVTAVSTPANGTATINLDGTVSYTPAANYNGADSFTYTVSDTTGRSDVGTVSVTVAAVNDAPTISGTPATSVNQDAPYSFTPTYSDVEGDTPTFSIVNKPSWAAFDTATGALTGTPANADVGITADINISVTDGAATASLPLFAIEVINVNDAPTISGTPATTVDQDVPYSFTPTADDIDGDIPTFSIVNKPAWALFDTVTGTLSGTPVNADVGLTSGIVISVSDALVTTDLPAFDIEVLNVNDAPTASGATFQVKAAEPLDGDLSPYADDIDVGDTLTFAQVGTLTGLTLNPDGTFTYSNGTEGTYTFDYQVSDGSLASNTATVTINVVANLVPVASDIAVGTDEDTPVAIDVVANTTDSDGFLEPSTVAVSGTTNGGVLAVDPATGVVTYTPNADYNGPDSFTYTVQDDQLALSNEATVTITVNPVNDAPTIAAIDNPAAVTVSAVNFDVAVLIDDIDSGSLTLSAVSSNTAVAAVGASGSTVSVDPTGVGTATVTVTVSDGALEAQQTFTVTVIDDPVLSDYSFYDGQYLYDFWLDVEGGTGAPMYAENFLNGGVAESTEYRFNGTAWDVALPDANMVVWDSVNMMWVQDKQIQINYTISPDTLTLSFQNDAHRIGTVTDLSLQIRDIQTGPSSTLPVTFSPGAKQYTYEFKQTDDTYYTNWQDGTGFGTLEDFMNYDGTFYVSPLGLLPIVTQKSAGGMPAVDSDGFDITILVPGMTGNLVTADDNTNVVGTWSVGFLPNDSELTVFTELNTSAVDYAGYEEGDPTFALLYNGEVYMGDYSAPMADFITRESAGYNQTAMDDILAAFASYTPPVTPSEFDSMVNTPINQTDWDAMAKVDASALVDISLWGIWMNLNGEEIVSIDSGAIRIEENTTVSFIDNLGNVSGNYGYTVNNTATGPEYNVSMPSGPHLFGFTGVEYDEAALESMFGIPLPAGSMAYETAHLSQADSYDFWGALYSYDINFNPYTFTTLDEFVATNQGGIGGYVFHVQGNTGLQFNTGDAYADTSSNGTIAVIDFTDPANPVVVGGGTWSVVDNNGADVILVDVSGTTIAVGIQNDGSGDYVAEGEFYAAGTGDKEIKFNLITRDALVEYFNGGATPPPSTDPTEIIATFDAATYTPLTQTEYDAEIKGTFLTDTDFWGVWPNYNGTSVDVDGDSLYFDSNGTLVVSGLDGTLLLAGAYTVSVNEATTSIAGGHKFALTGTTYDDAALTSMLGISMPAGSLAYETLHLRLSDEYDFWGPATSLDSTQTPLNVATLEEFVAANQGGLSGYVFGFDDTGSSALQFNAGDSYVDGASSGTIIRIDMTTLAVVESGSWSVTNDGVQDIIVIDLASRPVPYIIAVQNDGSGDYIAEGELMPANTGEKELKFNTTAKDALVTFFNSL